MDKISIINLKGGVGKSVTAINLAAEYSARGLEVLVVDLDKQANTTKFYKALDYAAPSTADVLTDLVPIERAVRPAGLNLDLLPANMTLLTANRQVLMDTTKPQQVRLREALASVEDRYDVCIMDCPPDLDMGSINALCAADWVIVPVDCAEWATDGMREILDQMDDIRRYYNPRLKLLGALITKYERTRAARRAIEAVGQAKVPMLETMIRYTTRVKEACAAHKALRDFVPGGTATQDYADLADEIGSIVGLHVSNVDTREVSQNEA